MAAVKASPTAMAAICASDVAITKYAASAAGANYSQFDTFTALAADSTAMGKVAASEVAMTAVAASQVAMTAVAASQVAMAAVRASNTAMTALEASTTAYNALLASSLITRYNPANENTWRTDTVYSGSGILVRLVSFQASGNWYKLDGGAQVTLSGKDNKVVKAFNTKLEAYWVDYQEDARGVYYIKC